MKYALITGSSGGIGRELANCFAADGTAVILVARSKDKLEKAAFEIKSEYAVEAKAYVADLTEQGSAEKLYEWTKSENLTVDYLVNNAGYGDRAGVKDAELGRLQGIVKLNIEALVTLSKLFGAEMSTRKEGKIVNIASMAGFAPGPGMAVYYASKAFVISFSQALAEELRPCGVSVTTICPSATQSGFADAAHAGNSQLFKKKLPSSQEVAQFAYQAIKSGKTIAIWGLNNKITSKIISLLPRRAVLAATKKLNSV